MLSDLLRRFLLAVLAALAGGCALQLVPTHQVRWEPITSTSQDLDETDTQVHKPLETEPELLP